LGNGRSWKLDPTALTAAANDNVAAWCYSTVQFDTVAGIPEFGTPAAVSEPACAP
jgi:hypothetical protein